MRNTIRTVLPVFAIMLMVIAFGAMIPPTHAPPSVTAVTANVTSSSDVYINSMEQSVGADPRQICPVSGSVIHLNGHGITSETNMLFAIAPGASSSPTTKYVDNLKHQATVTSATAQGHQNTSTLREDGTHRMRNARI